VKLYKTNLSISRKAIKMGHKVSDSGDAWETIPAHMIVAAQLLVLIERTGARQFIIHSDDNANEEGILVCSRSLLADTIIARNASQQAS
jgi:hypothetical protein